jgi:hypothetical protein
MITVKSNINNSDIIIKCNGAKKIEILEKNNIENINLNYSYPNITLNVQEFSTYNKFIYNEDLVGVKNGINNTFTIQSNLIPNTEQILSNGFILNKPEDYNISGNTIILTFSPGYEEQLTINYIKQ